ncbi:hypothetical protein B0A48_10604 [Cryoendolithus antarcticus]|uniref:Formin GTPase-binding domain-containing protein n=1 Tax=Cryoendolithus antarcticus TaxID=1507870 RepID=A0A1V8SYH6_9PEZI|nr:hypothetical protein B0A48_10604 [Cryoendolithus antarcticus]
MASASPRPHHQRNKSSRSGILRSLVSKTDSEAPSGIRQGMTRTQTVPLLPADHPHAFKTKVLGERQSNVQSPPSSPSKRKHGAAVPTKKGAKAEKEGLTKSKSSTGLTSMFSKMNRSSKDLSSFAPPPVVKDKENSTPPSSSHGPANPPIWAQFSSTSTTASNAPDRPVSRDSRSSQSVQDEITRYTPQNYSPSKQRDFHGAVEQPSLRPTLSRRPQSTVVQPTGGFMDALGRRASGARASIEGHTSPETSQRTSVEADAHSLPAKRNSVALPSTTERKASGSSTEQGTSAVGLTVAKRTGRVMAAVAALQGKTRKTAVKSEASIDPAEVDAAFEAVLESRNIPPAMRVKMRSLTLRVKTDFIRQDQGAAISSGSSPVEAPGIQAAETARAETQVEDDAKATKQSRPRSRTFTFTRRDKSVGDASPPKKARSQSKSRPTSIHVTSEQAAAMISTPSTPTSSKRGHTTAPPSEYITYLKKNQDPVKIEVGRLHKLRILLRNETVAWVDGFVTQGGMAEVVALLHRTMAVEWREEHEDQLLHETLLCLKGLCTTERAMVELDTVADVLFPALLGMLFDDEKKGPAEYSTRTIIVNVLFNYLNAALNDSHSALEQRALKILAYLGEPAKPDDARPVDFVLGMHAARPYKLWCREVTNTTKEVFWIFLHQLNVVPLPSRPNTAGSDTTSPARSEEVVDEERVKVLEATYTQRHFPGLRPPVPAAPYIGGVEWDATTYITAHLDLLNGLVASLPILGGRNTLRAELQTSGFEKTLGGTLRTCKEKFYSGVHDGLRSWVAAAAEDGWETQYVREGPTMEERADRARSSSPKKSPVKKEAAPQLGALPLLEAPRLDLGAGVSSGNDDDGWLG